MKSKSPSGNVIKAKDKSLRSALAQIESALVVLKEGTYEDRISSGACMEAVNIEDVSMEKLCQMFSLAANKVRLHILNTLAEGSQTTQGLFDYLYEEGCGISQPALWNHLRMLSSAGWIDTVKTSRSKAPSFRLSDNPYGRLVQHCLSAIRL